MQPHLLAAFLAVLPLRRPKRRLNSPIAHLDGIVVEDGVKLDSTRSVLAGSGLQHRKQQQQAINTNQPDP
ncbi:hypothetical protein ARSEF4850_009995 [Beauveria asiatica]